MLNWPLSTIRLVSENKVDLVEHAVKILNAWKKYTNRKLMIYAKTEKTPHQTITPVARHKDGHYELDLILRNNLTTDEYPLGLFHPHQDKWHIKKENIGLIEAMGLAILPARLEKEMMDVKSYVMVLIYLNDQKSIQIG
jgi:UDPglucose--hexose-1-phosphate uridylyltransferase